MTTPQGNHVQLTGIEGVDLRRLSTNDDPRGGFAELMRESSYGWTFRQSNLSKSSTGVLRGLHFHRHQADLWFVVEGRIQVGLADIRGQERFRSASLVMSADDAQVLFIPPGVAHGFLALTESRLLYWVTEEYDGSDEYGIMWNDPLIGIPWQQDDPILSERDLVNPPLDWDNIPVFEQ